MNVRACFILLVSLALSVFSVRAEVLYSQPFEPAGGFWHSSRWDPDGSDWDQYIWDAFRLDKNAFITEVRWRGTFDPSYNGSGGPVRQFRIAFHTSTAWDTEPNVVDPPLKYYLTVDNANQTPAEIVGGVQMYAYTFTLPQPFFATRNRKYWVQIEAWQWGVPDWSLEKAASGDGMYFRGIAGSTGILSPALRYQRMSGDTAFSIVGDPAAVPRPAPFDLDGDGKTDISIFRPTAGEWWWQRSGDAGNGATQFGNASDKIVAADFTGDGKTDIAFWRPSSGYWYVLRSEDSSYLAFPFGSPGDIPMPADYDGDGKYDPAVFRPADGIWYIMRSTGGTLISQFGMDGDQPIASDYDADGKADIAVFRRGGVNGAEWWGWASGSGLFAFQFGLSTDVAVPGDYTGDGRSDPVFYRPSTGDWFIIRSEYSWSYLAFRFGTAGDIPTPGDYDGDGRFDAAVFRPSTATWYALRSTGAGPLIVTFGVNSDFPVPNAYVR